MEKFNHIINWTLKSGSHDFPGPDGGTCINEAAIVAAGFKYHKVSSANDCPPCFSRVIATYALKLNDAMPDDLRQKLLLPFVTKLAGTADSQPVERERAKFMAIQTINKVLPIVLAKKFPKLAFNCANAKTLEQAQKAADAAYASYAAYAAYAASYAADAAAASYAAYAASYAADAADAASYAARAAYAEQVWQITTEILAGAIKIGNHQTLDEVKAIENLELIKCNL